MRIINSMLQSWCLNLLIVDLLNVNKFCVNLKMFRDPNPAIFLCIMLFFFDATSILSLKLCLHFFLKFQ